jgi:probable HAF family extracellular repeat protein
LAKLHIVCKIDNLCYFVSFKKHEKACDCKIDAKNNLFSYKLKKAITVKKLIQSTVLAFWVIFIITTGLQAAQRYYFEDLGSLGKSVSPPMSINARSQVVGWSYNRLGVGRAFLKNPGQPMQDLGFLGDGSGESFAVAINDGGQIVGSAETKSPGVFHVFLKNPEQPM